MSDPTALYRLFAANDVLLYVGISKHPHYRFRQHASEKAWWELVDSQSTDWFESRRKALEAETAAITSELPLFNIDQNDGRHRPWAQMMFDRLHPILQTRRLPAYAKAALLEPRLITLLELVLSWGPETCGECIWPEVRDTARSLVGFDADAPWCRSPVLYEDVLSTLYECLPWAVCAICEAA